jgi:endonuclease/exonuclease/phosphatase family metal-dependent hydrolase
MQCERWALLVRLGSPDLPRPPEGEVPMRTQRARTSILFAVFLGVVLALAGCSLPPPPAPVGGASGDYLFCFWNLENLFDDKPDRRHGPDAVYDKWFAENAEARKEKYDHLGEALVKLNDGRGPDILAAAELESERAAELLREALNKRLPAELQYEHVLMKEVSAGRHIAPAIITRLPVDAARTQLLDKRRRILEGHIVVNGHDLVVIASHWTSRVSDEEGEGRDKYAKEIYGRFRAMYESNPDVDLLVCGDFNDTPDSESVVKYLHATTDRNDLRPGGPPALLALFKERDDVGSHYYSGRWYTFDQIVVSPGLLEDRGWTVEPQTARIVNDLTADRKGRPWRFGNPRDQGPRGYSDHFPVTVRLKAQRN